MDQYVQRQGVRVDTGGKLQIDDKLLSRVSYLA